MISEDQGLVALEISAPFDPEDADVTIEITQDS